MASAQEKMKKILSILEELHEKNCIFYTIHFNLKYMTPCNKNLSR